MLEELAVNSKEVFVGAKDIIETLKAFFLPPKKRLDKKLEAISVAKRKTVIEPMELYFSRTHFQNRNGFGECKATFVILYETII